MANDISLTSGMRGNLVTLQQTAELLNRTQERLSTGKEVNHASDNPVNYFTAQSHMNRAGDLSLLKDGMNEAVQTVKAAEAGIEGMIEMIQAAKGLGNAALSADANQVEITLANIAAGDAVTIGGVAYTATASDNPGANEFTIGKSDASTASNLSALINATNESISGTIDISAKTNGQIVTIQAESSSQTITDLTIASISTASPTKYTISAIISDRNDLAIQYDTLIDQLDALALDAGYKGVNLLREDTLNVKFEGSSLDLNGFSATASDLGAATSATSTTGGTAFRWTINNDINTDINKLEGALGNLRRETTKLATNLSIINARKDFTDSMVKTLEQGSDNLTLADMNEEGANMLMLQTRQALGTTALQLSAEAAQSVLRLF